MRRATQEQACDTRATPEASIAHVCARLPPTRPPSPSRSLACQQRGNHLGDPPTEREAVRAHSQARVASFRPNPHRPRSLSSFPRAAAAHVVHACGGRCTGGARGFPASPKSTWSQVHAVPIAHRPNGTSSQLRRGGAYAHGLVAVQPPLHPPPILPWAHPAPPPGSSPYFPARTEQAGGPASPRPRPRVSGTEASRHPLLLGARLIVHGMRGGGGPSPPCLIGGGSGLSPRCAPLEHLGR